MLTVKKPVTAMKNRLLILFFLLSQPMSLFAGDIEIRLKFTPDLHNGMRIYETCATCHLPEGWGNSDGTYPQIAGQHQNVLIQQLLDIRNGIRDNPLMYPFVQERTIGGYQALSDVVAYVATLPMNPDHKKGPFSDLSNEFEQGKKLYQQNCAVCHGQQAEGDNATLTPKLYGQNHPYLKRQIEQVKKGYRKVNPAMMAVASALSQEQLDLIVNFISYIPVPESEVAPSINWRNTDFYE